ncbi:MAG: site-2 protease family protein [Clostridia bacterium]|nr:site-2 protease family protein [Clostridia bacterium]
MQFLTLLASLVAVVCVFCPHEFAHAFVAYKNGDPTAKFNGRLTLNPLKHIDPAGFIACALVGFGWARPVPINPYNFKNYKVGMFTTAIAGVCVNYVIAFIAYPLFIAFNLYVVPHLSGNVGYYIVYFVSDVLYLIFAYSLCSVVFNLLPLEPLDGFRVVEALTREVNPVQRFLRKYGRTILLALIIESFLCGLLGRIDWLAYEGVFAKIFYYVAEYGDILGHLMNFATEIIGWPIQAIWSLVLL